MSLSPFTDLELAPNFVGIYGGVKTVVGPTYFTSKATAAPVSHELNIFMGKRISSSSGQKIDQSTVVQIKKQELNNLIPNGTILLLAHSKFTGTLCHFYKNMNYHAI